ncbi:MAG: glycine zipper 2TM domain-containing protein [Rudaea sp.]
MKLFIILLASMMLYANACLAQDTAASGRAVAHPPANVEEATRFGWAIVLRVDPIYERNVDAPMHEECIDEPVSPPPPREHADTRAGGTVIGALVGGVIGNLFGKGDGRKAATAAGFVTGGVIGNNLAAHADARAVGASAGEGDVPLERHCRQVSSPASRRIAAYDVEYRYGGEVYMARMPYDPGDRMRVRISVIPAD